jgi:hypothetical protein
MDEYYLVFRMNLGHTKGKQLSHLMDVKTNEKLLRGFITKRKMREFVEEFSEGMLDYMMLKPVS